MTYDEFEEKLKVIKKEFLETRGVELESIKVLEQYLLARKTRFTGRSLRSLKGLKI